MIEASPMEMAIDPAALPNSTVVSSTAATQEFACASARSAAGSRSIDAWENSGVRKPAM
jgi:hypothetical protein